MGLKRRPGEAGPEHYHRQIRQARLAVFKNHQIRWSTHMLQAIWNLHGHVARQEAAAPYNVAQATLQWRNLAWWKAEQAKPRGTRHASRYNPFLDVERYVVRAGGRSWQHTAKNRNTLTHLQKSCVHAHDVPWSSGKQASVQNLHQTGPSNNTHKRRTQMLRIHDRPPPQQPTATNRQAQSTRNNPRRRKKDRRRRQQKKDSAWMALLAQLEADQEQ